METNIHMIYDYHKILFTLLDRNYVFVNNDDDKLGAVFPHIVSTYFHDFDCKF